MDYHFLDWSVNMSEEINTSELKKSIWHNRMFIVICIASVIVAVGIFILLVNGYINKRYTGYEVLKEGQRQDAGAEKYLTCGDNFVKYSKDGISGVDINGKTLWTGSYEMSNPVVVMQGQYILVADIGGKDAVIYNGKHEATELSVDYEIKQADVSGQGLVALLLEDTSSDMINIYNPYDVSSKLLVKIPTNVDDGYTVCMAISPDGTSVVASYICIVEGNAESRVVFYNFSDVGKNSDCIVGAKNYQKALVTDAHFLSDDQVVLCSDRGFYVWKGMKQPKQIIQKKVRQNIKSVFYGKDNIGMVLETGKKKIPYRMEIYNLKGTRISSFDFAEDYNDITLSGNEILFRSAKECGIFRLNGVLRFHATVEEGIDYFFRSSKRNRYYLFNDTAIQEIKLR